MIFDITRLNNNIDKSIIVNEKYSFSKNELSGTDLLELNDVSIDGEIFKNSLGNIELSLEVNGVMVLPCAITLKPVNYPFNIEISGELDELMEENSKKFQNTIDILPIIWENILMEIPMRVVNEKAQNVSLEGDGWKFITEAEDSTSSPFDELKDLL